MRQSHTDTAYTMPTEHELVMLVSYVVSTSKAIHIKTPSEYSPSESYIFCTIVLLVMCEPLVLVCLNHTTFRDKPTQNRVAIKTHRVQHVQMLKTLKHTIMMHPSMRRATL